MSRSVLARYRTIFRIPTARICYLAVLLEGIFLFGVFAYVAVLLQAAGEPRASIAGLVIAAFAVGGIVYSFSVGAMLHWLGLKRVMIGGGLLMALGLCAVAFQPPWQAQTVAFGVMGLGFYMLHASIQIFVTELAPATRSSAIAFHTFSIFVGQAHRHRRVRDRARKPRRQPDAVHLRRDDRAGRYSSPRNC